MHTKVQAYKAVYAAHNSAKYKAQTHNFVSGGRTYQSDVRMPAPAQEPSEKQLERARLKMHMNAKELYRIEIFLETGNRDTKRTGFSQKQRERIIAEYNLEMNYKSGYYEADEAEVWAKLCAKYPEQTTRFKKYIQCQYALRYGEAPVTIIQEGKKE